MIGKLRCIFSHHLYQPLLRYGAYGPSVMLVCRRCGHEREG